MCVTLLKEGSVFSQTLKHLQSLKFLSSYRRTCLWRAILHHAVIHPNAISSCLHRHRLLFVTHKYIAYVIATGHIFRTSCHSIWDPRNENDMFLSPPLHVTMSPIFTSYISGFVIGLSLTYVKQPSSEPYST